MLRSCFDGSKPVHNVAKRGITNMTPQRMQTPCVHHSISRLVEQFLYITGKLQICRSQVQGYYQEAGRAGRDGRPSECVLLYSRRDIPRLARMQRSKPKAVRVQDTINLTEVRGKTLALILIVRLTVPLT